MKIYENYVLVPQSPPAVLLMGSAKHFQNMSKTCPRGKWKREMNMATPMLQTPFKGNINIYIYIYKNPIRG